MNKFVKDYAKVSGVKLWQVAEAMGIQDSNLSKVLRHQLSPEKEAEMCRVVDGIAARNKAQEGGEENGSM